MAKDYTKYNVEGLGENLNKRQLVFNVIKDYIKKKQSNIRNIIKCFS